jgi:hypothetical protein
MKVLAALRLLLDVFGALFLGMLAIAPIVFGVFPYEGLKRLGTLPFYGLLGVGIVCWLWLVARRAGARSDDSSD